MFFLIALHRSVNSLKSASPFEKDGFLLQGKSETHFYDVITCDDPGGFASGGFACGGGK